MRWPKTDRFIDFVQKHLLPESKFTVNEKYVTFNKKYIPLALRNRL